MSPDSFGSSYVADQMGLHLMEKKSRKTIGKHQFPSLCQGLSFLLTFKEYTGKIKDGFFWQKCTLTTSCDIFLNFFCLLCTVFSKWAGRVVGFWESKKKKKMISVILNQTTLGWKEGGGRGREREQKHHNQESPSPFPECFQKSTSVSSSQLPSAVGTTYTVRSSLGPLP